MFLTKRGYEYDESKVMSSVAIQFMATIIGALFRVSYNLNATFDNWPNHAYIDTPPFLDLIMSDARTHYSC